MVGVAGFEPATKRGLHYVCRVSRALYVPDNKKSTPGRSTLGVLYNYGGILFGVITNYGKPTEKNAPAVVTSLYLGYGRSYADSFAVFFKAGNVTRRYSERNVIHGGLFCGVVRDPLAVFDWICNKTVQRSKT